MKSILSKIKLSDGNSVNNFITPSLKLILCIAFWLVF